MRYFLLLMLMTSLPLATACLGAPISPREQAQSLWSKNEKIIVAATTGKKFDLEEFEIACDFFYDVAEISVPGDHSYAVDWYPIPETASALPEIQTWYLLNGDRLHWDSENEEVVLKPAASSM